MNQISAVLEVSSKKAKIWWNMTTHKSLLQSRTSLDWSFVVFFFFQKIPGPATGLPLDLVRWQSGPNQSWSSVVLVFLVLWTVRLEIETLSALIVISQLQEGSYHFTAKFSKGIWFHWHLKLKGIVNSKVDQSASTLAFKMYLHLGPFFLPSFGPGIILQ